VAGADEEEGKVGHYVTSHGQEGGTTAHTVNINPQKGNFSIDQKDGTVYQTYIEGSPKPEIQTAKKIREQNPDGTFTTLLVIQVVAETSPSSLYLRIKSPGLIQADVSPAEASGGFITSIQYDTGFISTEKDTYETTIPAPRGTYNIFVLTPRATDIQLGWRF
jgi:hypothetical protein